MFERSPRAEAPQKEKHLPSSEEWVEKNKEKIQKYAELERNEIKISDEQRVAFEAAAIPVPWSDGSLGSREASELKSVIDRSIGSAMVGADSSTLLDFAHAINELGWDVKVVYKQAFNVARDPSEQERVAYDAMMKGLPNFAESRFEKLYEETHQTRYRVLSMEASLYGTEALIEKEKTSDPLNGNGPWFVRAQGLAQKRVENLKDKKQEVLSELGHAGYRDGRTKGGAEELRAMDAIVVRAEKMYQSIQKYIDDPLNYLEYVELVQQMIQRLSKKESIVTVHRWSEDEYNVMRQLIVDAMKKCEKVQAGDDEYQARKAKRAFGRMKDLDDEVTDLWKKHFAR